MINGMVATICKANLVNADEVRSWPWEQLLFTYRQVGKTLWDEWVSDINKGEIWTIRAISAAMGGKANDPLPEYDKVAHDPWEPKQKKVMNERMRLYHEANNIPIPPEFQ